VADVGRGLTSSVENAAGRLTTVTQQLADDRLNRLTDIVRHHPRELELDPSGFPAVRGEIIVLDPSADVLAAARADGFVVGSDTVEEGLDTRTVVLQAPTGLSLKNALAKLRKLAPGTAFSSNALFEQSGSAVAHASSLAPAGSTGQPKIGLIDGGVGQHPSLPATIRQRGFAPGAPKESAHGTAIASILIGHEPMRGVARNALLLAADVYGDGATGGNAFAIARAIGWLIVSGVSVINVSLVGPDSPILARAVSVAQARGVILVAAVGNDGAAAPPAYPASYPQVISVTGVDGKNRPLIEAGRALHLDYAAPGADLLAASGNAGIAPVRGTSFAAPFVTARLALLYPNADPSKRGAALARLNGEAKKIGSGKLLGRGLLCGDCALRK
jgi:subtilisin family serine protease